MAYSLVIDSGESGEVFFKGMADRMPSNIFTNYEIARDKEGKGAERHWVVSRVTENGKEELARSRLPASLPPLGLMGWAYNASAVSCAASEKSFALLNLNNCPPDQFGCYSFAEDCLLMERRCDEVPDCSDGSDEEDCSLVEVGKMYNSRHPAPPLGRGRNGTAEKDRRLNVTISVIVRDIIEIDELQQVLKLTYDISLAWLDRRLAYKNLKAAKVSRNELKEGDKEKIWLPSLYYNRNTGTGQVTVF